ncbi:MAG: DUF3846 domain-containing protein [Clostridia bacterium]
MKVIIKEPVVPGAVASIDGTLKGMQDVVGGYIQTIPLTWMAHINKSDLSCRSLRGKDFIVVLNEEGKLEGLAYNMPLHGGDFIAGTLIICREDDETMVGLTDEEAGIILGLIGA